MRSLIGTSGVVLVAAMAVAGCGSDSSPTTGGTGGVVGSGGEGGHGGAVDFAIAMLSAPVQVSTDARGVPYIVAKPLPDAFTVEGHLHARDQFARMDIVRKRAAGRLAEVVGIGPTDPNLRRFNVEGVAARTEAALPSHVRELHQAYADGVNVWLENNPPGSLNQQRGITETQPREISDSVLVYMGRCEVYISIFSEDVGYTDLLTSYVAELGEIAGETLSFEDMYRTEPMTQAAIVPDALGVGPKAAGAPQRMATRVGKALSDEALARRARANGISWMYAAPRENPRAAVEHEPRGSADQKHLDAARTIAQIHRRRCGTDRLVLLLRHRGSLAWTTREPPKALKKEAALLSKRGSIIPAASYSPTALPLQYHRL